MSKRQRSPVEEDARTVYAPGRSGLKCPVLLSESQAICDQWELALERIAHADDLIIKLCGGEIPEIPYVRGSVVWQESVILCALVRYGDFMEAQVVSFAQRGEAAAGQKGGA